jgi:hypothetical protein
MDDVGTFRDRVKLNGETPPPPGAAEPIPAPSGPLSASIFSEEPGQPGERQPSVFADLSEHIIDLEGEDDVAEELLTVVPIRRPSKKHFLRAHPSHRFVAMVYEEPDTNETYYVHPRVRHLLTEEEGAKRVYLALCTTKRKTLFFWPITTTSVGQWHATAVAALDAATKRWVKVISDRELGGYRVRPARADYGEPDWGDHSLEHLLDLAFRGRVILDQEHKVLKDALGEPV